MKRRSVYLLILSFFSLVAAYFLSQLSLTGRVGINLIYTQYKFLKHPYIGFLVMFLVFLILFFILHFLYKRLKSNNANKISLTILFLGVIGTLFTFYDFTNNLSHKLLGWRFHFGTYLFWLGWISIPIYYLTSRGKNNNEKKRWNHIV
ncbi:hypothetical protein SAMN02745131_01825 [Flavisolibacter ginsengisoli DSM 18119]|uniref:Uncharacterized protein n=1 Tax=Flavisolibacter ginsengisoli DSM 18119 TaxID=1121884 RepID=A0A1M4Z0H1_9BACT|nr:hypothetical protein SAMN02745131_01825 [Flavisolibacter ginsengisoli DSM 18119]